MVLRPDEGLHPGQYIPWVLGAIGTAVAAFTAWLTRAKLNDERVAARQLAANRNAIDTAAMQRDLTRDLMNERTEREAAMAAERTERDRERDMMEGKIGELKSMIEALQDQRHDDLAHTRILSEQNTALQTQIVYKDRKIEQLEGQIRQLKQISQSVAALEGREDI